MAKNIEKLMRDSYLAKELDRMYEFGPEVIFYGTHQRGMRHPREKKVIGKYHLIGQVLKIEDQSNDDEEPPKKKKK
jgi:hypothetical protein